MREWTFLCLEITKWIEVGALATLTAFMIFSCVETIRILNGRAVYLSVLSIIACVLACLHLLFHNLVTNCRFSFKIWGKCCGYLMYDWANICLCHCIFGNICKDRCCSILTAIKWSFKIVFLGVLIGLFKDWKKKNNITALQNVPD